MWCGRARGPAPPPAALDRRAAESPLTSRDAPRLAFAGPMAPMHQPRWERRAPSTLCRPSPPAPRPLPRAPLAAQPPRHQPCPRPALPAAPPAPPRHPPRPRPLVPPPPAVRCAAATAAVLRTCTYCASSASSRADSSRMRTSLSRAAACASGSSDPRQRAWRASRTISPALPPCRRAGDGTQSSQGPRQGGFVPRRRARRSARGRAPCQPLQPLRARARRQRAPAERRMAGVRPGTNARSLVRGAVRSGQTRSGQTRSGQTAVRGAGPEVRSPRRPAAPDVSPPTFPMALNPKLRNPNTPRPPPAAAAASPPSPPPQPGAAGCAVGAICSRAPLVSSPPARSAAAPAAAAAACCSCLHTPPALSGGARGARARRAGAAPRERSGGRSPWQ